MFLLVPILVRLGKAGQVVWVLLADRTTSRRLPWAYLRRRAVRDARMRLQLSAIVAAVLVYPATFVTDGPIVEAVRLSAGALWLVAVVIGWSDRAAARSRG